MNMRNNNYPIHPRRALLPLAPLAHRLLARGLPLLLASTLRLLLEITQQDVFSPATAADYGAMLEFPVAAVMLLTCAVLVVDALCKRGSIKEP